MARSTTMNRAGLVVGVVFAAAAVYTVARRMPESSTPGRLARDVEARTWAVPRTIALTRAEVRRRLNDAVEAFRSARIDSERSLTIQLEEAKKRGALPPA